MSGLRVRKITVIVTLGFLVLVIVTLTGISLKVGWSLTHPGRRHVTLPAAAGQAKPKPVAFASRKDNMSLAGWFLTSGNSDKTIIFAHGYGQNRLQNDVPALDLATALREKGYNILLFDFRACGESGGSLSSIGQFEKEDLLGAVDFMKGMGRPGNHIGVIGFSMGAVVAVLAAAEDPRIEAVVADAPFSDLQSYLTENLPVWSGLPSFPFTPLIMRTMPLVLNLDPASVSPIKAVPKVRAPVLFIHGMADTTIPPANSEELFAAAPGKNRLWEVPGAKHVGSFQKQPEEYLAHVLDVFRQLK